MDKNQELRDLVEKRVRTVFIGAISSVEESHFGSLRKDSPEWDRVFRELRKEILDKGNEQLRLLLEELGDFNVGQKRYQYKMPMFNSREEIEAYKRGQRDANKNY